MGSNKWTQERFLEEAASVWGDRWDYSDTVYSGSGAYLHVRCREHGTFTQICQTHLKGSVGCPGCKWGMWDTDSFIQRATLTHGEVLDYSSVRYVDATTPVILICRTHGEFEQSPSEHIAAKNPCAQCAGRVLTTPQLVERARAYWGSRFDYSKTTYVNESSKVKIICREHGEFEQVMRHHIQGRLGCSACRGVVTDTDSFIAAVAAHGFPLTFEDVEYTNNQGEVILTCSLHGPYKTVADYAVQGYVTCNGCKSAHSSAKEREVAEFIREVCPNIEVRTNVYGVLPTQELDIYIPELHLAVEFNGLYYHSSRFKPINYHYQKYLQCKERGIRLLQVWEDDWDSRKYQVREHLKQVLGVSSAPKYSARSATVVQLNSAAARDFLTQYHIQGFVPSSTYLGLVVGEDIIAVASFKRSKSYYVLTRYATKGNVRGGHSKLVRFFERTHQYTELVTFADLTFSDGGLYKATGWVEDKLIPPDYMYLVKGVRREHKFNYRIQRFRADPSLRFQEGLSERQLAALNQLDRIYDAGKIRFTKRRSDTT